MPSLPYSLEALLMGRSRSIARMDGEGDTIIPDVVISELHTDDVTVTQHPVDTGANISDHAFVQPAGLSVTFGWSDSSRAINSALGGSILQGLETTKDVYDKLLDLKNARMPLRVSTGKRVYENMVLTNIRVTTTVDTESAAIIEMTFQEVFLATAQTVSLQSIKQKNPGKTAAVSNKGSKQLIPVQGTRQGGINP